MSAINPVVKSWEQKNSFCKLPEVRAATAAVVAVAAVVVVVADAVRRRPRPLQPAAAVVAAAVAKLLRTAVRAPEAEGKRPAMSSVN